MSYYYAKTINGEFGATVEQVRAALQTEGFGVLTEIDVQATMKKKLNEQFRPYVILGACNPPFAFQALTAEDKIGTMLPCNVIVQQRDDGVEVAAVNPIASMQAVENDSLAPIAQQVSEKLQRVIQSLK